MTDLPTSWNLLPLAAVAEVRLGRQRSPKNHSGTQMRPYLRAANVDWNGLKLDDVKEMNFTDAEMEIYRLEPGDIVLGEASGSASEVGKPGLWSGQIRDCAFQNTLLRVRSHGPEPRYLLHWFRHLAAAGAFAAQSRGVGIHHIGRAKLAAWPVPIPPIDEQRRIVDILEDHLSRLDVGNALVDVAAKKAERLLQRAIESFLTGSGGARASAELSSAGVDDGRLPELGNGWVWRRLGELADVVGGVTKDASKQGDPTFVHVPYLRVANVQRGRLDLSTVTTIGVPPARAEALRLRAGDVLLNEGGDRDKLGRGWIWEDQIPGCIHQNHVFRARVRDDVIDPRLLSWAANTIGGRWCERNGKQSVNLASISLSRIRLMPIPVPPADEQPRIVKQVEEVLAAVSRLNGALDESAARSAGLRRGLLGAAFSGQLTGHASDLVEESIV